jgi:hypothetical protein
LPNGCRAAHRAAVAFDEIVAKKVDHAVDLLDNRDGYPLPPRCCESDFSADSGRLQILYLGIDLKI